MKVLVIIGLIVALCAPAFGAVDLVNGKNEQSEITLGVYAPNATGSQDYVREFDGRTLNFGSIEYINLFGYSGPYQYSMLGRYLMAKDADSRYGLSYKNLFGTTITTSTLTHRLGLVQSNDPYGNTILNLSPGRDYFINREVDNFNFRITPDSAQSVRIVVNSWMESEDGMQQLQFRSRQAQPGVINNSTRATVALPVDRNTSESTVGTDLRIGGSTVVNYRYSDTKFGEGDPGFKSDTRLNFLPLNHLTQVGSDTKSSIVKVRSQLSKKLYLTGVQTNRQRDNTQASILHPTSASIGSTNAALTYMATDNLTFTGRYRRFDQDNDTAPILSGGEPTNMALSNAVRSASLDATYTGISHAFLKMGFERRDTDRTTTNGEPEFPEIQASSKANILTGGFRYYPNIRLSLSGNGEWLNADNAGYAGTPDDRKKVTANATYMIRDNAALYADYNMINERNSQISVPWSDIPASGNNAANQELREEAAGQGYKNKMTTTTLGTWYALSPKLVLDANYAKINTDASALWIIGTDPSYLAHIAPDLVPYQANNNQWSAGATYTLTSKARIYGRYLNSKSDGKSILDSSKYPNGIGSTWSPVSTRENRYTIGFAYDVSAKDNLSIDYSISDWKDDVDSANDGTFGLWRVGWAHQF